MEYIKQEFSIKYTIKSGKVRSSSGGEFENSDKEVIKYNPKTLIICENTYDEYNEETDCMDLEEDKLVFRIDAETNVEAGNLVKKLRDFFKAGGVLEFEAGAGRYDMRSKMSFVRLNVKALEFGKFVDEEMKKLKSTK